MVCSVWMLPSEPTRSIKASPISTIDVARAVGRQQVGHQRQCLRNRATFTGVGAEAVKADNAADVVMVPLGDTFNTVALPVSAI